MKGLSLFYIVCFNKTLILSQAEKVFFIVKKIYNKLKLLN